MAVAVGCFVEAPGNPVAADELIKEIAAIAGRAPTQKRTVLFRGMEPFQDMRLQYRSPYDTLSVEARRVDDVAGNDAPLLDAQIWARIIGKADDIATRRGYRREVETPELQDGAEDTEYEAEPSTTEVAEGVGEIEGVGSVETRPPE